MEQVLNDIINLKVRVLFKHPLEFRDEFLIDNTVVELFYLSNLTVAHHRPCSNNAGFIAIGLAGPVIPCLEHSWRVFLRPLGYRGYLGLNLPAVKTWR